MKKRSLGASLIEVLVSLLILSCILLGFDAMEANALRMNHSAYFFSVAANQLHSMAERIYANAPQDLTSQISSWNQQNQVLLPQGIGTVTDAYPHYVITLSWGEKSNSEPCKKMQLGQSNCLLTEIYL